MIHVKTVAAFLVCFAAFQISYGLRVRRQVDITPASTTLPVNDTGNNTIMMTAMPINSTDNNTIQDFPILIASSSGVPVAASAGGVLAPLADRIKQLLDDPGTFEEIEALRRQQMITELGLDATTAAGMSFQHIKAKYIIFLIETDPYIKIILHDLWVRLNDLLDNGQI